MKRKGEIMYDIVILDDDERFGNKLKHDIGKFLPNDTVQVFQRIEELPKTYNVLFLDIELDNMNKNGFEVANELRKDRDVKVIFVSSHEDYAFDGYLYDPYFFISKSRLDTYLPKVMEKLMRDYHSENRQIQLLYDRCLDVSVPIANIQYAYREGNYVEVNAGTIYYSRTSIKRFQELVDNDDFLLPSSGYLVNINYIKEFQKDNMKVIMTDGKEIPISRDNFREFIRKISKRSSICSS